MKKLFVILLLSFFSTQSIAEVGDTYYCIMNQHIKLTDSGVEELKLERFKIKVKEYGMLKSMQNPAFTFHWGEGGKEGSYSNMILNLEYEWDSIDYKTVETYSGSWKGQTVYYHDGNFYFAGMGKKHIKVVMAECEVF